MIEISRISKQFVCLALVTLLLAIWISIPAVPVSATSICDGAGGAKTTFRPGSTTAAETRTRITWKYDCNYGTIISGPVKVSASNYYNSFVDATELVSGWYSSDVWGTAAIQFTNSGWFTGCDSGLSSNAYKYYLHNYVYTTSTSFGAYIRHCWIDNTTSYMPVYSMTCGNY